jgi:hypothetical protein
MRRLRLIRLGQCEDLTPQSFCTFRWHTVLQNSNQSTGITHGSCASHFPGKTSIKAWRILLQRTNIASTSAWTGFRGVELQIVSDLLCQRICSTTWRTRFVTTLTLKGIRIWCRQGESHSKNWIGWSTRPRSSLCLWRCLRSRNSRVDPKSSREIQSSHTDRPSTILPS